MIVITGASDGLGRELARLYKDSGKAVINLSRSENPEVQNIHCDLTDKASLDTAIQTILGIKEPLEAFILCAGVFDSSGLDAIDATDLKKTFRVNVEGNMLLVSKLIDRLKADAADIVSIVSTAGTKPTNEFVYGSSKWAMRGFTLGLQQELKATKCRVLSICPGGISTGLFEKAGSHIDTTTFMDPAEVAKLIKQLLDLPKNMEVSEIVINRK